MEDRRRARRMSLDVPLHVEGHDVDGSAWAEMTHSVDASDGGLAFELAHPVDRGSLLHLSLPLPRMLRRYDPTGSTYKVFALVREVQGRGPRRVGVQFLGQHPPKGHLDHLGRRYRLPGDRAQRQERRSERRLDIFMNVIVRCPGQGREERTIAENIGRRGARTLTSLPIDKGDVVDFEEIGGDFRARAEVRHVFIGADRIPRLNLLFLDATAPSRLVP